jgi:hypothetical protein
MSYTVKPNVGHIKVKNSVQVLMHVEHITNEIHKQVIEHFPNHLLLKNNIEFIESILKTVIDAIKDSGSKADEKTIILNIFSKLFTLNESEKSALISNIDYLLINKIVKPKSFTGKAFSSLKKVLSSKIQSKR